MNTGYGQPVYGTAGYPGTVGGVNPQTQENIKNILRWVALILLGLLVLGALIYLFRYLTGTHAATTTVTPVGTYSNLRHHVHRS